MWTSKVLAYALVWAALCWTGLASAEPDDAVEDFFGRFREKRDGVGSIEARFVQKTIVPDEVLTTEGTLRYSRPRRIMFVTEAPERAILVDGRRGYEYDAEIRQLTIFDIEDHPRANIFFLGFDDNTEALRQAYQVSLLITEDARGREGIKIEPRLDSDDDVYFMEVNLFLRDSDMLPYRIHIVNDEESQLFIDVAEIVTHPETDLSSARIFIPEGVKIIENDAVVDTVGAGGRYVPGNDAAPEMSVHDLEPPEQALETSAQEP